MSEQKSKNPLQKLKEKFDDKEEQLEILGTFIRLGVMVWAGFIISLNYISLPGMAKDNSPKDITFIALLKKNIGFKIASDENKDNSLDLIDDRLYKLRNLSKKHNCQIDSLPQKQIEIEQKLNSIKNFSLELDNQKKLTNESYNEYLELAKKLSINRIEVSQKLINEVNDELPALKLENAKFSIIINPLQDTLFSSKGIDDVKFYAQTNKDTKLGKISEIASGGELSRFLLIMKLVIEKDNTIKTLIFDEVDSGVGGATASAIGTKLLKIGNNQQTIVVTHSPQVAAKGNHHILIKKSIIKNETITETFELNHQEKIEEIARMISDDNISDEARNAALKLLN